MSRWAQARRFINEVRVEARKTTWPEYRETLQATVMVVLMVVFVALFLWMVDSVLGWLVQKVI